LLQERVPRQASATEPRPLEEMRVSAPVPAPAAIDMASLPIDRLFEAESVADVPELGAVAVPVASAPAVAEPAALESGVEAPAEPPALRPGSKAADVRNWFGQPGYVEKLDKETASRLRDRTARLSSAIPSVNLVGVIVLALAAALAVVAFLQYRNFEHGQLIKMGKEYLKEKHFELALKRFDAAAQIRPDSAAAHYYKGLSLLRLNKPGQAAQQFDRCLSLDGERPLPFLTRAQANIALGEFDGAVSDSTKALELDPSLIKAYLVRARGYLGKKQAAQARKDLDKVNLLNCPQGLKLEYYDLLCDTLAGEGKYKSAARQLTKVIGAEPGLVSAYLKRAGLFMHLSRWGDAIDDYTHALRRQPHDGSIFSKRGLAYKRAGKLQQAIADFDRALTYLPDSIEALMNRGRCHMELRNLGQAKYDFERVLALDKGNEEAGKMVKEIASGLERLRHATTAVTTASANDATAGLPGDAKELSMLGYNSMKAGNYRLAVQALSKAVKVSPNDANLRRYLAHALIASGQRSFAMQQLKALLSLEPSAIADRVRLVRLLMEAGLYQEAMAICDAGALIGGSETELEELKKVRVQAEIEMRGQMNDSSTSQPTPSWKIPGA